MFSHEPNLKRQENLLLYIIGYTNRDFSISKKIFFFEQHEASRKAFKQKDSIFRTFASDINTLLHFTS